MIEILVAIVFIAVAFIPILGFFSESAIFTNNIEQRNQAIKLAQDTVEQVKLENIDDWDNINYNPNINYLNSYIDSNNYDFKTNDFVINLDTESTLDTDADGTVDTRVISVTVSWANNNRQIVLRTMVVNR